MSIILSICLYQYHYMYIVDANNEIPAILAPGVWSINEPSLLRFSEVEHYNVSRSSCR
jgi:hypothetical protein